MTEAIFWFFLVVGPVTPDASAQAALHQYDSRQACWAASARLLADKPSDWLLAHLVTPCGPHPAMLVPPPE